MSFDGEEKLRSSLQALLEFCWDEILREGDLEVCSLADWFQLIIRTHTETILY